MFDYRKILKAYLRHVGEMEGTSFLGNSANDGLPGLTAADLAELRALDDEVNEELTVEFNRKYPPFKTT